MKAENFTIKLLEKNIVKPEEIEIYRFGIECLILKTITFLSYISIAFVMRMPKEFAVIMLVFVPLRRSAGGYHASTRLKCYIMSCGVLIIALLTSKANTDIFIWTATLMVNIITILRLAPIDNENKKMDQEELLYFKSRTRKILFTISMACGVLVIMGLHELYKVAIIGISMASFFLISGQIQLMHSKRLIKND